MLRIATLFLLITAICSDASLGLSPSEAKEKLAAKGVSFTSREFLDAAEGGDIETVKLFIAANINLEAKRANGDTALLLASRAGRTSVVKLLLKSGADPSILVKEISEKEPWRKFLLNRLSDLSEPFLVLLGAIFTFLYNQRSKQLHELETIEKMLPHLNDEGRRSGALVSIAHLAKPELAAQLARVYPGTGAAVAVTELLRAGKIKDRQILVDVLPRLLIKAAADGEVQAVQILLGPMRQTELGLSLDAVDENGRTAVMWAARNDHVEVLDELLAAGAKVEFQDRGGETVFHLAAKHNSIESMSRLLRKIEDDKWAAKDKQSLVNTKDKQGRTALARAKAKNFGPIIAVLQQAGAVA